MSSTVRITINKQLEEALSESENWLPGLEISDKIRTGFLLWVNSNKQPKAKNQGYSNLSDEEFDKILESFANNPKALKLSKGKSFQDWWQENKDEIRE
jgi:hypothetical protein